MQSQSETITNVTDRRTDVMLVALHISAMHMACCAKNAMGYVHVHAIMLGPFIWISIELVLA